MTYTGKLRDMLNQTRAAEQEMQRLEQELRDSGYVNTIHDCWEKPEPEVDSHKLGFCIRYACGQTCVGCGDTENGGVIENENQPEMD
jgi:hypothetical protein